MADHKTEEIDARSLKQVLEHALEQGLGHAFRDRALLRVALTHRSHSNEEGADTPGSNYERLEFLGDSVLGLVTASWLYRRFPDSPEGDLARIKSFLVSAPALKRLAQTLGVGPLLRLGVGEERSGGRKKASILADVVESLFGAVYLDGGFEAAERVILPAIERLYEQRADIGHADSKTILQEAVQARGWKLPNYRLVAEGGPDHDKVFTVDCWVEDRRTGTGTGRSKKLAEQAAAADALDVLDLL